MSMLAAVRGAMAAPDDDDLPETGVTGADAPKQKETAMSGKDNSAGVSQADHEAAVQAAETKGREAGAKAASDRLVAALSAEGVNGDGARMAKVLGLAVKYPSMSGEDIAAVVVESTAAAAKPVTGQEAHDLRVLGAGQAQSELKPETGADASKGWSKTAQTINAQRG